MTQEELKEASIEAKHQRAFWATKALATFAVVKGDEGDEVETLAKDLLTDLFHLSDMGKFNLESIIDQARWAYEGEKKIDDIEEEYLRSEILKLREQRAVLLQGGAEVAEIHVNISDIVTWAIEGSDKVTEGKSPRKKG